MAQPLVCIGHSQVRSVAAAAQRANVEIVALDFWQIADYLTTGADGQRFCAEIERHLSRGRVFSLIGGNAHHLLGLVAHPRRFDFVLASEPSLPMVPDAEVVPLDAVRAAMTDVASKYVDLMRLLRRTHRGPLFHIQPPPVLADEAVLTRDVPWMFFQGRRIVSPRLLRYKLWRLHGELLIDACQELDMTFVPCPPQAFDGDGYLARALYEDAMHVNVGYGTLVLDQMLSHS